MSQAKRLLVCVISRLFFSLTVSFAAQSCACFISYSGSWLVVNMGKNQVRLCNNNNYLAIVNGNTVIVAVVSIIACKIY